MLLQIASNQGDIILENIEVEVKGIKNALSKDDTSIIPVETFFNESPPKILSSIYKYERQIKFLHYAGHASHEIITFQKDKEIYIKGFAQFLKDIENLHFVFLNGCGTYEQAEFLLENGVKIILVTRFSINDLHAKEFAITFYEAIANGKSLEKAYKLAIAYLQMKYEKYLNISADLTSLDKGLKLKRKRKPNLWELIYVEDYYSIYKDWQPIRRTNNNELMPSDINNLINEGYEIRNRKQKFKNTSRYDKQIKQRMSSWNGKVQKKLEQRNAFDELFEFHHLNMKQAHSLQLKKKISLLENLNIIL
jgi:hypothetical protein